MNITSLVENIGNNIVQFQPTIQGVVSAVLTTLFLRKKTNISEFEKMKAGKYSEALDDLLENGKITYFVNITGTFTPLVRIEETIVPD